MARDMKKLISQMSLDEKIGQMIQLTGQFFNEGESEITGPLQKSGITKEYLPNIGSILGINDAATAIRIQDWHLKHDRNKIPMMFMRDVIHGWRTIYPIPLGLGASFDPTLAEECSRVAAKEASAGGVQVTFTPMVDYVRDARWGRVMESCGEDPLLNSRMGASQVRAFQGDDVSDHDRIAACVKHFAAYGGAEAGRDYNTVEISERTLREYYLPAYRACVDAGVKMLMPSFNSLNGIPSTANRWLMQTVLKKEWGYNGVVISDWGAVRELCKHGIAADNRDAAKMAVENGCDIEMMSYAYYQHLKALVEEGTVSEDLIDAAVERILCLKDSLGLFDDPYHGASPNRERALNLCDEHKTVVRRAAVESSVLLQNNGVLPFSEQVKRVALIGPFADSKEIIGPWACAGRVSETVSVEEGVRALLPNAEVSVAQGCTAIWNDVSTENFEEAVLMAKNADAVILCLGEPCGYCGEGNCRTDIRLPGAQNALAKAVISANPNTAVLLFHGRPLVLTELSEIAPAILTMWFPGTEGGNAAAELLFGRANPSGKVPMSFPRSVGQCPIYYNRPSTGRPKTKPDCEHQPFASNYIDCGNLPLYSFGHGLSYSELVYESLTLDCTEMSRKDRLVAKVTLRNAGMHAAKETVQLYLRDHVAATVRPIQSLIAFEKVALDAGERKTVTFEITEPMLRFYDFDCNLISEAGEFTLSTGYADHLILSQHFCLLD